MPQHRYHIHVCLVRNEQPDLENALQIAMADSYFLTWDLVGSPANFMDYTRRQIDQCDYVLFILGDSYGNLSPSGVSFLHLSYVYATTKRKTLFTMIKQADMVTSQDETRTRQRSDFASMMEKDQAEYTTLYAHNLELAIRDCLLNLAHLIKAVPKAGWAKSSKPYAEQHERLFTPNKHLATSTKADILSHAPIEKTSKTGKESIKEPIKEKEPIKDSWLVTTPTKSSPVITTEPVAVAESLNTNTALTPEHDGLSLEDSVTIRYTSHAYRDGNLTDLNLQQTVMWLDIVVSLRKMKEPFTPDMMQRNLSTFLNGFALAAAKHIQPNTHAVARTQINPTDFEMIKKQLVAQNWLTPVKTPTGLQRDLWQLSDELK